MLPNITVDQVVFFQVEKIQNQKLDILFQTKDNFKIYEENLSFDYQSSTIFPMRLPFQSKTPPLKYEDPIQHEIKNVFTSPNHFYFTLGDKLEDSAVLKIHVQACASKICLLPATLTLPLQNGSISYLDKNEKSQNALPFQGAEKENPSKLVTLAPENKLNPTTLPPSSFSESLTEFIENSMKQGSLLLLPAIFFAGLLMNLTPCVYPMIPITINVLSQFGLDDDVAEEEKKRRRKIYPMIYVAGMVFTYTLLGVFAAMTGTLFGSQLSKTWFSLLISAVMFLLGLMMMGYINLSRIQNIGYRIPLAKNHPAIAVATMGGVSGLIAAPCTGPVLSLILILISQTQNPLLGFIFMFVFSLGFGLPYIFLGFLTQKLSRLPKFPGMLFFTKILFASFIFSLSIYFLKSSLEKFSFFNFIFYPPPLSVVSLAFGAFFLFFILSLSKKRKYFSFFEIFTLIFATILSVWLTFYVTKSFYFQNNVNLENQLTLQDHIQNSPIHWTTNIEKAFQKSQELKKPIFVDIWANWCSACLKMEQTTWQNEKFVKILNDNYVTLKLDDTNPTSEINELIEKWKIVGLPAAIILPKNSDKNTSPVKIIQGEVEDDVLFKNLELYQK